MIGALKTIPQIEKSKIVVAFSGGEDSAFLLASLLALKKKFGFSVQPVHINHKYLKEDDFYVKIATAAALGLGKECVVLEAQPVPEKTNLENWMREERYRLLEEYRAQNEADFIAVAHHKKDLAESVLMHIFRGCGLKGLRGMEIQRKKIIRPLLFVDKEDITRLLQSTKIPYYNDKLNYSLVKNRSKIRFELLPQLKENFDPQIEKHLANLSQIVSRSLKEKERE